MRLLLLHSPLVGPGTWRTVAPLLRACGHDVAVPDLTPAMCGAPPYYPQLARLAAEAAKGDCIVVVHSGAGALVPAIAERAPLKAAIFVDALLPHPGEGWFAGVPEQLGTQLRNLAKDAKLPPWHAWWPKGAMEKLLPDAALRQDFIDGQGDLPLAYFEERAPDTVLTTPSAYLQLSDAYAADADAAQAAGWPVTRLKLHHLAMLTHPDQLAAEIERMAVALWSTGLQAR